MSPNPFTAIPAHAGLFLGWAVGILIVLLITWRISLWKGLQRKVTPALFRIKKYAPIIERVTISLSLIASGYYQALFGPELPLSFIAPGFGHLLAIVLIVAGVLVLFGFLTRLVGLALGLIYILALGRDGVYLVSYLNYFGTALLLLTLGGGLFSLDKYIKSKKGKWVAISEVAEARAFFVLRVLYGTSLIFAAYYAKVVHSNLALDTIADYHLTNYFPFEPLFLVMGAACVEFSIGLFILLGFQIRIATLVFTGFLTASIIFFGESVWPHIILFGLNVAIFVHGYDKYTLMKKISPDELEPVL